MAITVTLEEAQANLRLQGESPKRPAPGSGKGSILFMSPDSAKKNRADARHQPGDVGAVNSIRKPSVCSAEDAIDFGFH